MDSVIFGQKETVYSFMMVRFHISLYEPLTGNKIVGEGSENAAVA